MKYLLNLQPGSLHRQYDAVYYAFHNQNHGRWPKIFYFAAKPKVLTHHLCSNILLGNIRKDNVTHHCTCLDLANRNNILFIPQNLEKAKLFLPDVFFRFSF